MPPFPSPPVIELETHVEPSVPYYLGEGIEDQLPARVAQVGCDHCFLVTSEFLRRLLGQQLVQELRHAGVPCAAVTIPESESNKSWQTLQALCEELVERGVSKDSLLLAFGGGLIGNVVGLAAGLIYRGIRFVEIPTTVMAQTDGVLSNKQAINGEHGKNQFGLYHAPVFVWADVAYPRHEPVAQIRAALAEWVKNVLISDEMAVQRCERLLQQHRTLPGEGFGDLVRAVIESKLQILRQDPSEKSRSVILEYGHTFGHALEWLTRGRLLHGEAVTIGMCLAATLSRELGFCGAELVEKHEYLLGDLLRLATRLPGDVSPHQLYRGMLFDNKRDAEGVRFLLLEAYGRFVTAAGGGLTVAAPPETVLRVLERSAAEGRGRRPEAGVR